MGYMIQNVTTILHLSYANPTTKWSLNILPVLTQKLVSNYESVEPLWISGNIRISFRTIDFFNKFPDLSCKCKDFIDSNGLGNCMKSNASLDGSGICYVHMPSTCSDLNESASHPGERFSAEACLEPGIFSFDRHL